MPAAHSRELVLASSSAYRRALLERLRLPFTTASPDIDELAAPGELAHDLALRLAIEKARVVGRRFPQALVIGSDQVAEVAGTYLGKPGGRDGAVLQLQLARGQTVTFDTALCLLDARTNRTQQSVVQTRVTMRNYTDEEIARYIDLEQPYDCAGGARIEALGIALVARIDGNDPSALIGLPLVALCGMLRNEGIALP